MTEDELVDKYVGLVKWVAARRVPQRDFEDAVQDGLLGIIWAHRRFDPEIGGPWHDRWIVLSIERSIIDGQRKRTGRRIDRGQTGHVVVSFATVLPTGGDGQPITIFDLLAGDDDDTDAAAIAADLERWLRALPLGVVDRRVLDGLLDGVASQDIAEREGVTPGRISQRVRHIREVVARRIN